MRERERERERGGDEREREGGHAQVTSGDIGSARPSVEAFRGRFI